VKWPRKRPEVRPWWEKEAPSLLGEPDACARDQRCPGGRRASGPEEPTITVPSEIVKKPLSDVRLETDERPTSSAAPYHRREP
jgi:hypothetical protein